MEVHLLRYTPEPEEAVAAAARLCYSPAQVDELMQKMSKLQAVALIEKLVNMGHYSPLEHASFTFGVSGVSRALSHQLVRHRIASYSQQSQRYVKLKEVEMVVPPSISAVPEAEAEFRAAMTAVEQSYRRLLDLVPAEDARYVLPNACPTNLVVTMNARSLLNFFQLRCCNRAQWEIRELAWQMRGLVMQVAPSLFTQAGPDCFADTGCKEGKMSCGMPPFERR